MLRVAQKLKDNQFFLRLNTIPKAWNAVANDVKYHHSSWVSSQGKAEPAQGSNVQETENVTRSLAEIEILQMINETMNDK